MRTLLILSFILLSSCAHIRWKTAYNDHYVKEKDTYVEHKQCRLPLTVSYEEHMDPKDIAVIRQAMRFWENQLGHPMFYDTDLDNFGYKADIRIRDSLVGEDLPDHFAAVTQTKWDYLTGCITDTEIIFIMPLQSYVEWEQLKIAQHEIGHALGFDDIHPWPRAMGNPGFTSYNPDKLKVMYSDPSALRDTDYMVDSEVNALRRMYLPLINGDFNVEAR